MSERDLSDRIGEQLGPVIETVQRRIQADLTDRDKAAIAHGLVDAAVVGARVAYAAILANATEAGVALPPGVDVSGFDTEDLWPFDD